jgi:hypothetical protein
MMNSERIAIVGKIVAYILMARIGVQTSETPIHNTGP